MKQPCSLSASATHLALAGLGLMGGTRTAPLVKP
jgi:hypothetical protein